MAKELAVLDEQFAEDVAGLVDVQSVQEAFRRRYGDGWQRKLANNLGVAESTLSGWLKKGEFPPVAKLSLGMLLLRHELSRPQTWRVVKSGGSYAVYSFEDRVGRTVAENISKLDDAFLIAAAPALRAAGAEAWVVLDDANQQVTVRDSDGEHFQEGLFDQAMIDTLRDALDAAEPDKAEVSEAGGETE